MILKHLCPPALLNVAFSLTQIVVDMYQGNYNTGLMKFMIMIIYTLTLELLCRMGLSVVSWFIVFLPFVTMTIVTALMLYFLELSPTSGKVVKRPGETIVESIKNIAG